MKYTTYTAALAAMSASLGSAVSVPRAGNYAIGHQGNSVQKRGTARLLHDYSILSTNTYPLASKPLGFPDDTLKTNCVSIGFLPSEGDANSPRYTMADINSKLGAKSATYGWYAQITSDGFSGQQFLNIKDDIVSSGAVFVASVMPYIDFSAVTPDIANQVASVLKQFTDAGVTVWLRYGHEMNYYVTDGTYKGDAGSFVQSWKNIYNAACKDNDKIACFWSPNQAGNPASDLQSWWPGEEFVDLVGIDCYPTKNDDTSSSDLFDKLYGGFYDAFSKPYGLPFAIGETGAGAGQKGAWLKTLVEQKERYPLYVSMSWFEYDKEADFRIVETDEGTLGQTKGTLLAGGNDQCGGSGNGTAQPAPSGTAPSGSAPTDGGDPGSGDQCDWGCWGWDCSASVPCQDPWSCKGGYCK